MPDSTATTNPVPPQPTDPGYRVLPKHREKDRQRQFDSLFQEEEGHGEKKGTSDETDRKEAEPVRDTYERKSVGDARETVEASEPPKEGKEESSSDRGNLIDVTA
jgi:hypothetical protein